jgi:hypothetical protein
MRGDGPSRAFISYSHDSDEHRARVLTLANQLRGDGVDARMDVYVQAPPEGWPRWVRNQLDAADFVLCICSERYREAFDGHNPPNQRLGVSQEGYLIAQELYRAGNYSDKYVPVLFDPWTPDAIPDALSGFTYYRVPAEYGSLYRRLTGQPAVVPPPIGAVKRLAAVPLPVQSNGFQLQAELIAPETMPLEYLAPRDGLFLPRIINPPSHFGSLSTVWLSANGPRQYIIDSIRIQDLMGFGLGPTGVAVPPDAEYRFTFIEGRDEVRALNPALSIGPETRNRASFLLGVAADQGAHTMGTLLIWLMYHTSDGASGSLLLDEPDQDMTRAARLAGTDILWVVKTVNEARQVRGDIAVTANGMQRGLDATNRPGVCYEPLDLLRAEEEWELLPHYYAVLPTRAECQQALEARRSLHQALADSDKLAALRDWLASDTEGALTAADLLGGIAGVEATDALLAPLAKDPLANAPLYGLCVRHLATGDGMLAEHVLRHWERLAGATRRRGHLSVRTIAFVLALRPGPGSLDVLLLGRTMDHQEDYSIEEGYNIGSLLKVLQEDIEPAQLAQLYHDHHLLPPGSTIFVRGTMNKWGSSDSMLSDGRGRRYQASLPLKAQRPEFKLADKHWMDVNFGARAATDGIVLGQPFPLYHDYHSSNIPRDLSDAGEGVYTFTLEMAPFADPTLVVSRV